MLRRRVGPVLISAAVTEAPPQTEVLRSRLPLVAGAAAALVHCVVNPHYGFFRDELYFILCGLHPAFGYVDQPPVVPMLSAATQLFGHSLFLLRVVPALCAGGAV